MVNNPFKENCLTKVIAKSESLSHLQEEKSNESKKDKESVETIHSSKRLKSNESSSFESHSVVISQEAEFDDSQKDKSSSDSFGTTFIMKATYFIIFNYILSLQIQIIYSRRARGLSGLRKKKALLI